MNLKWRELCTHYFVCFVNTAIGSRVYNKCIQIELERTAALVYVLCEIVRTRFDSVCMRACVCASAFKKSEVADGFGVNSSLWKRFYAFERVCVACWMCTLSSRHEFELKWLVCAVVEFEKWLLKNGYFPYSFITIYRNLIECCCLGFLFRWIYVWEFVFVRCGVA